MPLLQEQPNNENDELHIKFGVKDWCNAEARAKGRQAIQVLLILGLITGLGAVAVAFFSLKGQNDETKQPSIPQLTERNK